MIFKSQKLIKGKKMEDVNLMIEVTRRCNFSCGHCLRGEAQNKDLDIFKFRRYLIDEGIKYINHLTITGGEPLMAVKQLKEIAAELRWGNVGLGTVYIATNGSYFTPEAMEAVYEIYRLSEAMSIQVSNSQWHKDERSRLEVPYISTNSELEEYMNEKIHDEKTPRVREFILMVNMVNISMKALCCKALLCVPFSANGTQKTTMVNIAFQDVDFNNENMCTIVFCTVKQMQGDF